MPSALRKAKRRRHNIANTAKGNTTAAAVNDVDCATTARGEDVVGAVAIPRQRRLPCELWLMVLSHFTAPTVPELMVIHSIKVLPPSARARVQILRSLSQTCRELRDLCLYLRWRHLELCTSNDRGVSWRRSIAYSIRQTCLGLHKTPRLALHVQTMTVSLAQCATHPVLKVFGRCLASLQNLRVLSIISCDFSKEDIRTEFSKRKCPSIRKVLLPALACPILQACINTQSVEVINGGECQECMGTIARACVRTEHVEGIMVGDRETCEAFSKRLTRLTSLRLIWPMAVSPPYRPDLTFAPSVCVTFLAGCSSLRKVALSMILSLHRGCYTSVSHYVVELERFLQQAKRALEELEGPVEKQAWALCRNALGQQIERSEVISE